MGELKLFLGMFKDYDKVYIYVVMSLSFDDMIKGIIGFIDKVFVIGILDFILNVVC